MVEEGSKEKKNTQYGEVMLNEIWQSTGSNLAGNVGPRTMKKVEEGFEINYYLNCKKLVKKLNRTPRKIMVKINGNWKDP